MSEVVDGRLPYSIGHEVWPGLSKLVEEMGELGQVLGKIMGVGGLMHWDGDLTDRLHDEIGDVLAALAFFQGVNGLDLERTSQRMEEKAALFMRWHLGEV